MADADEQQRLKEEAEIRERDKKRQQEKEEYARKLAEQQAEENRRRQEEEQRRVEEQKRRKREEEEWKRLGPDVIQELPPVPPPLLDDNSPNAVSAWYLDDEVSKPTLSTLSLKPGRRPNTPPVTMKELHQLGVVIFHINLSNFSVVKQIVKEREYKHTDEVKISQTSKDDVFLARWFQEHYNEDEQIRLVTDGSCYLDVRSKQDKWIRMHVNVGDLVIFPAGMYHRGTLDEDDFVALFRGLRDAPRFVPINRTDARAETMKVRLSYLMMLKKGNVATEMGFH
uniref:Iron(II)-requiring acireductone dioxygenase n=1 Tax=Herpetomonas muscarum TaxID=5718 RepID=U5KM51_HERMU|nr:iron(II)-requiring acireductone dioxygenase [Herpetomonas muscarum]